ncbi:MAG: PaaI family thioesterase [bacterium]
MPEPRRYALESLFGPGRPEMVGHVPHAQVLGIRVVEIGPGFSICSLPYRDELIGDPQRRVVFGGAITTLLDHASGLAVACAVEELNAIATIDLRVDYLRAAQPGLDLQARSECYRLTRNVAFIRAIAYEHSADDPFASCLGTFMLGANRATSSFDRLIKDGGAA